MGVHVCHKQSRQLPSGSIVSKSFVPYINFIFIYILISIWAYFVLMLSVWNDTFFHFCLIYLCIYVEKMINWLKLINDTLSSYQLIGGQTKRPKTKRPKGQNVPRQNVLRHKVPRTKSLKRQNVPRTKCPKDKTF